MRTGALLIFVAVLVPGCSFVLVKGEPSPPIDPTTSIDCTTSQAAPVADVILGVLSAGGGVLALATAPQSPCRDYSCLGGDALKRLGIAGVVVGGAYLASAVYGFTQTNGCKEGLECQRACLAGDRNVCDRLRGLRADVPCR
jgi:hypothetical protein